MADGDDRHRPPDVGTAAVSAQLGIAPVVGRLVGSDEHGLWVDFPGNPGAPVLARSVVALDSVTITAAIADERGALLIFEHGRTDRPIVLGLVHEHTTTGEPALVRIDGQRVVLEGKDEVELRCGAASITLRRNGRIVIRGVEVETRARGANRIRGGTVLIN